MSWLLLLFIIYSLLPVFRQRMTTSNRFKAIKRLEQLQRITNYMISKGWYHPYNAKEQIQLDMENA